ncbi:MAG: Ig-like domain-containing protein [Methylococcaceae bacterium]|nr:Ig-like domain-containing protein [Methylococcaceae bacterium]
MPPKGKTYKINLSITKPNDNERVNGSRLVVEGAASETETQIISNDPNADPIFTVLPVDLSISLSGSGTIQRNAVKGTWAATFNVTQGQKTVTVIATTRVPGRANKKTVIAKFTVVDALPPVITISEPAQGAQIEGPGPAYDVRIAGKAVDQSNIKSVQYRVDNTGNFKNVVKDSGSAKSWNWSQLLMGLSAGVHNIEVRATDQHNNSTDTKSVSFKTFRETNAPLLEIKTPNPATGAHTVTFKEGGVAVEVSGTAVDEDTRVETVQWQLDGGELKNASNVSGNWSNWRFTADIPSPGLHEIKVVATDIRDNSNTDVVSIDAAIPFELDDIGFAPYLQDLMSFTRRRIRQMNNPAPVEIALLKSAFHQHYDRLALADFGPAATQPVAQVRIAIEVLRSFLANSSAFPDYLETAYRLLLSNLGTSHAEIRLMRTADADTRQALANRLGIATTGLDTLFIAPELLTEAGLQNVFGLIDTTQDPIRLAVDQAELLTLQLSTLHTKWLEQDQQDLESAEFPIPVIDPDIIDESDIKNPVAGNTAYDLFVARKQWLADQYAAIKLARESQATPLAGFDHVVAMILGNVDLPALQQQYEDGVDIAPELQALPLALNGFFALSGMRKLAETGVLTDSEWTALYHILLQARKQREFVPWASEEVSANLVAEPAYFTQSNSRPELTPWRSSWRARRDWEKKLAARINQRQGLIQAHRSGIEATEEVVLPLLRDNLINTIDRQGFPDIDIADWLTQRLSLSFKYSGDQRISRLQQGVETLQDLLLASRAGRLAKLAKLPVGSETPKWALALVSGGYSENDFDEEWQWMGSYATWRGAMFAFGYPENYLLPTLRPKTRGEKKQWTIAFSLLVKRVRQTGRLTAGRAEAIAEEYVKTLNRATDAENPGDGIPYDIKLTSQLTKKELRERRLRSKTELANFVDPVNGGLTPETPAHLKEIYFFVPMFLALSLQKKGEYLAALDWYQTIYAYELPLEARKIFFGLEAEEAIRTQFRRSPDTWLLDGLDVFDIARDRANALTRFTLLSIVRCYLAFADAEFTSETNESIPFARRLYITALNLVKLLEVPAAIAHWSFIEDEGATASDITGNGHAAILTGTSWEAAGWRGGAISLNASSSIKVPHAEALALGKDGDDFSVGFAVYLRESSTGSVRSLFQKGNANKQTPGISLQANANRIHFRIATKDSDNESVVSQAEIKVNQWTYIACVKQGSLLKLYINGQFDSETLLTAESVSMDAPLLIGKNLQLDGINALVDEIRIFDRALSADAVIALAEIDIFPANPAINALRQHAELNLKKLRNGLNIAGLERIRNEAIATELVVSEGGLVPPPTTRLRPTIYRYVALIERAKQLVTLAQQIEANFFAALEKRDAEAYTLLNAQHDVQLSKETVELQDIRIKEADSNIELMTLHQDRAQTQYDKYDEWINAGANQYERAMLNNYQNLRDERNQLADLNALTTVLNATVSAVSAGLGAAAGLVAVEALGLAAVHQSLQVKNINNLELESQTNTFNANLERRKDEWRLQSTLANKDIEIAAQQILQAGFNKAIVAQEKAIASLRSDQAQAVVEFLHNKFTNVELYEWMSDILGEIYSYFLQQATAMAQLAASQLAFERQQRPPAFIRSDYWLAPDDSNGAVNQGAESPDRRGLTGSARLLQDIIQLDQHAFETNQRKLQLAENFSLARLVPFEFQQFRETGILPFSTPMALFDQGFPGHYLRLIKRVRISVVGLIPPTQGIRATLSSGGISYVVTGGDVFRRTEVRRPSETIAFTSPSNASGLFELQPDNDLLLPFETMGVDANWELRLPKAANRFNFDSLADVIFSIEYTALHSHDYQQLVIQNLDRNFNAERAYSIKQDFPDLWYHLHQPDALVSENGTDIQAQIVLERSHFPPNLEALTMDQLIVFFVREDGAEFEIEVVDLLFEANQTGNSLSYGGASSIDGVISTRRANATSWLPLVGETPVGKWTLVFSDTQEFRNRFANEQISDILFVTGYSGDTPAWTS